jgi:nucleotide-binding universal stress UspA family protein
MTTYLVGVDGSEMGLAALAWARSVATADESIVAVHGWDVPVVTGYEGAAAGVSTVDPFTLEQASKDFLTHVLAEQHDARVSPRLLPGPAGRALADLAGEVDGDVTVVVGHSGSSKASMLLGSTAHHVIHHVTCPVVVVRGESRTPVRHAVVGVDKGDDDEEPDDRSLAALSWAVRLPGLERIEVSHADFVPAVAAGPVREPGLESDEAVTDDDLLLRHAIEQATGGADVPPNGAEIVPVVAAGTGAFALIEASRDVDLVVIGTRGRRGFVELLSGSTSLDVLSHAHCPVAVIH